MIAVNFVAAVQLTRQAVPGMLERGGGHIVNVSSMGAASVFPGLAVYSATKAGLSHFTAGLRADFRGRPIDTTLVELGATTTDMLVGVKSYPPTLAAFDRAYGWHFFVDTPPERVAEATVAAGAQGAPLRPAADAGSALPCDRGASPPAHGDHAERRRRRNQVRAGQAVGCAAPCFSNSLPALIVAAISLDSSR